MEISISEHGKGVESGNGDGNGNGDGDGHGHRHEDGDKGDDRDRAINGNEGSSGYRNRDSSGNE